MTDINYATKFKQKLKENDSKLQELREFYNFNEEIEYNLLTSDNGLLHKVVITTDNVPLPIQQFYHDCLDSTVNT